MMTRMLGFCGAAATAMIGVRTIAARITGKRVFIDVRIPFESAAVYVLDEGSV